MKTLPTAAGRRDQAWTAMLDKSGVKTRRIGVIAVTSGGSMLAAQIAAVLPGASMISRQGPVAEDIAACWPDFDGLVCVMAAGVVTRAIAPLLADKRRDPGVVVVDEAGRFAVSLLSGHLGGANDLAREVAAITGGQAVITTASDVLGLTALDLWARELGLAAADRAALTRASARLVNTGRLAVYSEISLALPPDFAATSCPDEADVIISARTGWDAARLTLHPPVLAIGVGCNRGTGEEEFAQALDELCRDSRLARQSVACLASIDLKSDEPGLAAFAERNGWPLVFFTNAQLNAAPGVAFSEAAFAATGAVGVAEPAALLAAGVKTLLIRKRKWKNVTMAVAMAGCMLSAPAPAASNR